MEKNWYNRFTEAFFAAVDSPVFWFRKNIVEPNQQDYPWYHRQFRRVPTIDECYTDDVVCQYEANEQFIRDRSVDEAILIILRRRHHDCVVYEGHDKNEKCAGIREDYEQAAADWFVKYGDLGVLRDARGAYMKQKHRMIWERRYGPVGSGMNPVNADA